MLSRDAPTRHAVLKDVVFPFEILVLGHPLLGAARNTLKAASAEWLAVPVEVLGLLGIERRETAQTEKVVLAPAVVQRRHD